MYEGAGETLTLEPICQESKCDQLKAVDEYFILLVAEKKKKTLDNPRLAGIT